MLLKISPAALLLLSACATTSGLLDEPAKASFLSARGPDAVERCLVSTFDNLAGGPVVTRGEAETRITFTPNNVLTLLLTVAPRGSGSIIEVRQPIGPTGKTRQLVETCV